MYAPDPAQCTNVLHQKSNWVPLSLRIVYPDRFALCRRPTKSERLKPINKYSYEKQEHAQHTHTERWVSPTFTLDSRSVVVVVWLLSISLFDQCFQVIIKRTAFNCGRSRCRPVGSLIPIVCWWATMFSGQLIACVGGDDDDDDDYGSRRLITHSTLYRWKRSFLLSLCLSFVIDCLWFGVHKRHDDDRATERCHAVYHTAGQCGMDSMTNRLRFIPIFHFDWLSECARTFGPVFSMCGGGGNGTCGGWWWCVVWWAPTAACLDACMVCGRAVRGFSGGVVVAIHDILCFSTAFTMNIEDSYLPSPSISSKF